MAITEAQLLREIERRASRRKLFGYEPYKWQREFHNAGAQHSQRMLMAANRTGKTFSAAAETAMHATGRYPDWWEGRRFDKPVLIWTGAITNEASKDIIQKALLGEPHGTGAIPGDDIIKASYRQAGIPDVVDTIQVKHRSGGTSRITLKTYEQGWRKWQGASVDAVWLDEEPDANKKDEQRIFTEALTRTLDSRGMLYVTFTPLLGQTSMVEHFMSPKDGSPAYLQTATWDDAPHLDKEAKAQLLASYPDHEVETRSKGIPMMGEGRVFPVPEGDIVCDPIEIPRHWVRICGVDFGSAGQGGHPSGLAWLAWDRDRDVVYLYDDARIVGQTTAYIAEAIRARGAWIPVSWPHDGMNTERANGQALHVSFASAKVNMLSKSARYPKGVIDKEEKGGGQPVEPIVMEMLERMRTGRFKVFRHCEAWLSEFRMYHRENGKIVPVRDDVLKASMYALMMLRYAAPYPSPTRDRGRKRPIVETFAA